MVHVNHKGYVLVTKGYFKGYNGFMVASAHDYETETWRAIVQIFNDGDFYAIPIEYVSLVYFDGRI